MNRQACSPDPWYANMDILLTKDNGIILGPIARILGVLLNAIFNIFPNVGLSIIIFTIVIYIILVPLTYRQQKFSKLSAKMNPELKAVQEKYKNKKDQESMMRQNEEMQAVYKKYGVSPTGSCVQLLIQMPILFALYRVINNIPAYCDKVYASLAGLAEEILHSSTGISVISGFEVMKNIYSSYLKKGNFEGENAVRSIVDVLNKASSTEWDMVGEIPGIDANTFDAARASFEKFYNFLGLNIAQSPMFIIKNSFSNGQYLLIIGAVLVPVLAAATQWLNTLFMPQPSANGGEADKTASMMKSMNVTMPLMSAFFCLSLPCGMGLYWISGAVIRCVEQVVINKQIDKMDLDALVQKNEEKYKEELEKQQKKSIVPQMHSIAENAAISTKKMEIEKEDLTEEEKQDKLKKAHEFSKKYANGDGIAAKAHMVEEYSVWK